LHWISGDAGKTSKALMTLRMKLRPITRLFALAWAWHLPSPVQSFVACAARNKAIVETTGTSKMKPSPTLATKESFEKECEVRLDQAKKWALACLLFGNDHAYQLPKDFEQEKAYASDLSQSNWEIISSGDEKSIVNPSQTILLRETKSRISPEGKFTKVYAFTDGHAEMEVSPDGDFLALKKERGFVARPAKN
jgi:hypothetical protein